MKIIFIALKEFIQSLRDIKTICIMIFMPTLLTIILGISFEDTFDNKIDLSGINIKYTIDNNEDKTNNIINKFVNLAESLNINIKPLTEASNKDSDIIIKIHSIDDINVSYNNKLISQGKIIISLLDTFIDRYKAVGVASPYLTNNIDEILRSIDNTYVKIKNIDGNRVPSSLDYYGVVMLTMTIMFASVTGAYKIIKERNTNTLGKLRSMSISSIEILVGKVIGAGIIVFIQALISVVISKYILGVYWGDNLLIILLVLLSTGIMSIAIGTGVGYFIKDNRSVWLILLMFIMICGFIGGCFVPLDMMGNKYINMISIISPLSYINSAILRVIYENAITLANYVIMLNFAVGLIFILWTSLFMEVTQ